MNIRIQNTDVNVEVINTDKRLSEDQFKKLMAEVETELRRALTVSKSDIAEPMTE